MLSFLALKGGKEHLLSFPPFSLVPHHPPSICPSNDKVEMPGRSHSEAGRIYCFTTENTSGVKLQSTHIVSVIFLSNLLWVVRREGRGVSGALGGRGRC